MGEKGTTLVSGGTGGLGIVTAEVLVELGIRQVVLASRSGRIESHQASATRRAYFWDECSYHGATSRMLVTLVMCLSVFAH